MSSAADHRKNTRRKRIIAIATPALLLAVSLLAAFSGRTMLSDAETGIPAAPEQVAQPGIPEAIPPRPALALEAPPPTPAEEIMTEISRFENGTSAPGTELLVADAGLTALSDPVLGVAADLSSDPSSPTSDLSGPADEDSRHGLSPSPLLAPLPSGSSYDGNDPEIDGPLVTAAPLPLLPEGEKDPLPVDDSGDQVPPVPEPATLVLVGSGLACLAGCIRRRRPSS